MSVNTHLVDQASKLIITTSERGIVDGHILALEKKIYDCFNTGIIIEKFPFGSFTRRTLMPRRADEKSDVDYMIVFEPGYQPSTYLRWLREFADKKYISSEIYPSHPTVVLELSRIKIELVPAVKSTYDNYRIPAPTNSYTTWMDTHPNQFNNLVSSKNTSEKSLIRPLIRLMKYWNSKNGYPFSSYELEQLIVNQFYYSCSNLWDYLAMFVNGLSTYGHTIIKTNKINKLKDICTETKRLENLGYYYHAEAKISEAFPIY